MNNQNNIEQFNIPQIILYHLLPGLPILLIAIIFANPTWGFGLPIVISLMLSIMLGLIPTQWLIIFMTARRDGKKIKDVISFTNKTSKLKTILWALPCFIFALLVFIYIGEMEHSFWKIFDWIPSWFRLDKATFDKQEKLIIIITLILNFIFNGLLGPLTEEIYFRGFLLPRMNKLGKLAPLINVALFSLYHFFTPWQIITRTIAITPLAYAVWFNKNIRIGMLIHCSLNTFSGIGMLVASISLLS